MEEPAIGGKARRWGPSTSVTVQAERIEMV
jgi:hypothetical protein